MRPERLATEASSVSRSDADGAGLTSLASPTATNFAAIFWAAAPFRLGVVTTLMLNFIAVDLTSWLVNGPLLARGSANSATPLIVSNAELPRLLLPSTLHLGFVLSLALVAVYGLWSQAHEGWRLVRDRYDDGGFSGGSMDSAGIAETAHRCAGQTDRRHRRL